MLSPSCRTSQSETAQALSPIYPRDVAECQGLGGMPNTTWSSSSSSYVGCAPMKERGECADAAIGVGGGYSPGLLSLSAPGSREPETTVFIAFCYITGTIWDIQLRQVGGRHDTSNLRSVSVIK